MPEGMDTFRKQYPQYSDLSDDQVLQGMYRKYYSDLPEDQFRQKFEAKFGSLSDSPGLLEAVGKRIQPNPESALYTQIPTPFGNFNLQQIADAYGVAESAIASLFPNRSGEKTGQGETAAQAIERGKVIGEALSPSEREELGYVLSAGSSIGAPSQKEAQDIGAVGASLIGDPFNLVFAAEGILKLVKLGNIAEATKSLEELAKIAGKADVDEYIKSLGSTAKESALKDMLEGIKAGKPPEVILEQTAKKNIAVEALPNVKGKEPGTSRWEVNPEALPDITQQPKTRKVVPIQKGQEPLPQEVSIGKTSQRRVGNIKQEGQAIEPKTQIEAGSGEAAEAGGVVQEAQTVSGKEYSKGLFEAVKKDITSKASGITPDPYRNVKQFISENKLELTDKEIETLNAFAKKTLRGTGTAAEKQHAIERYAQHITEARARINAPPPIEKEVNATAKEVIQPQAEKAATEAEQVLTETQARHQNITKILNEEVKPLNREQKAIYRKEKAQRFAKMRGVGEKVKGEAGAYAKRSQMAGEYTKVDIESLRNRLPQEEIDKLFDDLNVLSQGDQLTAINGMERLLTGKVPRPSEVKILESVYGKELTDALIGNVSLFKKAVDLGLEILNVPRSLMASFDLSAPFRQGLWAGTRHPIMFSRNFKPMLKAFRSEKNYQALLNEIHARPTYELMEKHGLAITELGKMSSREERFMSNLAEMINLPTGPKGERFAKGLGPGRIVRASGRAYTGFLDKFRADLFDYMVQYGKKFGVADDPEFLTDAAKFINRATGRGGLGYFERAAVPLNATIFSPRLMTSRLQLTLSPRYYVKMNPVVRREALKNLFSFAGMALTVAGVGKLAGADVGFDPRNADFMKLKFGNTRYDFLGGFQQPIRAAAQMLSGKVISSTTGKEITLGEGYKPLTRFDIAQRYIEMKESPVASFVTGLMRGRNAIGEKFDVPTEVMNRFYPMVAQDMADIYRERGVVGLPMGLPAIVGLGSQTYGGLQIWGLDNKDYPELTKELDRIKSTAGFPSTSAFGVELNMGEYKQFKREAGKAIAKDLSNFIKSDAYKGSNDERKKEMIESRIDYIKEQVRTKLFSEKEKQKYYEEREKSTTRRIP